MLFFRRIQIRGREVALRSTTDAVVDSSLLSQKGQAQYIGRCTAGVMPAALQGARVLPKGDKMSPALSRWLRCFGMGTVGSFVATAAILGVDAIPLVGHTGGVTHVAWSPDGGLLVSVGDDGKACIWSLESLALVRTLIHAGPLTHVAVLGNEHVLTVMQTADELTQRIRQRDVSAGFRSECSVWNIKTGERIRSLAACVSGGSAKILSCDTSPDGMFFALRMATEGPIGSLEVGIFDSQSVQRLFHARFLCKNPVNVLRSRTQGIFRGNVTAWEGASAFLASGRLFAFVGEDEGRRGDETIMVVDCLAKQVSRRLQCPGVDWVHLAGQGDGPLLAALVAEHHARESPNTRVDVWQAVTGQRIVHTNPMNGSYWHLQFSGPDRIALVAHQPLRPPGFETTVSACVFLDVRTGRVTPLRVVEGPRDDISCFACASDGRHAAIGMGGQGVVELLRASPEHGLVVSARQSVLKFDGLQQTFCSCFGFSPDGRWLLAACHPQGRRRTAGSPDRLEDWWKSRLLTIWRLGDSPGLDSRSSDAVPSPGRR